MSGAWYARMPRALLAVGLLAVTSSVAAAGPYVSLGLGNTGVDDSTMNNPFDENGRSLRLAGGYKVHPMFSVEGGLMGYNAIHGREPYDGRELFAAGKFTYPMGQGFSAFGRLGLQRTSLSDGKGNTNNPSLSGNGWLAGAGFEYNLLAAVGPASALANASVWVDYDRNQASVQVDNNTNTQRDLGVSMWTLGVTMGF